MQSAAITTSTDVDTRNSDAASAVAGGSKESVPSFAKAYAPAKAQPPISNNAFPLSSPVASHHMNTAVLNGVTYPSARAAAIAKEAVEAAQLYYNLFFQANEDTAGGSTGGGGPATSAGTPVRDGHSQLHRSASESAMANRTVTTRSHLPRRDEAGNGGDSDDNEDKNNIVTVLHSSGHGSLHASRTSSAHSNEASLLSVQTPVNVVDTAYHTFFPPVLSRVRREAIVERIVGHRPRPYNKWQWRKAEDYHELHAQNVHHNNVYHEYPSNMVVGGNSTGTTTTTTGTATTAAQAAVNAKGPLDTPLSTAPSYPTMSPVACVAGLNGSHGTAEENAASPASCATREGDNTPTTVGSSNENGAPSGGLPKVPSLLNEMPFELMNQLSMYTIPASQQGPEYFKKTAEDGTKTLIIFMMGLPARGKTFLAQKICRLLGWHGSRAKVQNIQVAWRRVLLDWEATHADQLAAGQARKDGESETRCDSVASQHAAAPATSTIVNVPDIQHQHQQRRSVHALSGQHPSHSSTQDEVSRVVRDLATSSLSGPLRRPTEAAHATAAAAVASAPAEATAGVQRQRGGRVKGPCGCAQESAAQTTASPSASISAASPVCPSMEPYTATAADSSTVFSDCASDAAVTGSPLDAALHSHLTSPTVKGATAFATTSAGADALAEDTSVAAAAAEDDVDTGGAGDVARPAMPADVLRTRHFRELIQDPSSVARRLYRYVLQSYADDCRLFFQHGGEVVVINDDFVTEELRLEAEQLFRPLAEQFFYMEVIRDAEDDPLDLVKCKIRDPMEYPHSDIDLNSATDDFHERLRFLESVYETLEETPRTKMEAQGRAAAAAAAARPGDGTGPLPVLPLPRSYVKIHNANTIETHGISGYLASRIISYVMNLSQGKIQHPIYFVRHGESCYNLEDRIGGNPLLTEQGMRDAGALLEFLASLKHHLKHVDQVQRARHTTPAPRHDSPHTYGDASAYTRAANGANTANTLEMWTSQLRRAIQTAELSERLLNIRTLRWSSLNEIHAGVCEDMTYDEVSQRYPLIDYFRKRSKYTFRYPEGESYQDLVVRLEPVIMELENADKVVVVVAHQAVLRCLLAYFGSTSAESSISVKVPHRTVWRCTYDSKGIASLDELKLDNYEAGFQLSKAARTPTTTTTHTNSTLAPNESSREASTMPPTVATDETQ